jgi:hypothetical protein
MMKNRKNPYIDEKYIAARNSLIPQAEIHANRLYGAVGTNMSKKQRAEWAEKWSRSFHEKMNELTKNYEPRKTPAEN